MIVSRISFGLGNQMFQYALGRHISHLRGTELKLDLFDYGNPLTLFARWVLRYARRQYELDVFHIEASIATPEDRRRLKSLQRAYRSGKSKERIFYRERRLFRFNERVFECGKDAILDGIWHNEKYFRDIAPMLRREFRLMEEPDSRNREYLERMVGESSVGIHVRRGDYTSPVLRRTMGTCSVDYYLRAMEYVAERVADPHFYIFSDDPDWMQENLKPGHAVTYVTHNTGRKNHEDLRLMSHCKHNIIANSSFSWWGAWLNANPDKIVVAPKEWLISRYFDHSDALPADWVRLPNR